MPWMGLEVVRTPVAYFAPERHRLVTRRLRSLTSDAGLHAASSSLARHYRHVQVIEVTSGASGVTMRAFGMFREFGGAVHGSTHTPSSSKS
jgi:hypothetical protein